VLLLLGGLVGVVLGFAGFADLTDPDAGNEGRNMALFAGGGLAMVVGLAVVGFTRARVLMGSGGYARVTYEQGVAPAGGRYCPSCGRPTSPSASFCDSCGAALG